jgi:hypothetical protein
MSELLHVKCPLFLSDFTGSSVFLTDFRKSLKYQILSKSVQSKPSCSKRTDGRKNMTKLTVAFRNSENAPKKHTKARVPDFYNSAASMNQLHSNGNSKVARAFRWCGSCWLHFRRQQCCYRTLYFINKDVTLPTLSPKDTFPKLV